MKLISSAEAAKKLGVHVTRVQVLIRQGRLPAKQIGGSYVIDEEDLHLVKDRKPGRPPGVMARRKKLIKRKK
jgi:excisionase family DNA binding protein